MDQGEQYRWLSSEGPNDAADIVSWSEDEGWDYMRLLEACRYLVEIEDKLRRVFDEAGKAAKRNEQ